MLTLNIGPLTLAMPHVILLGSLLLASLVGWRVGRRSGRNPERQLFRLLLVAVLVAVGLRRHLLGVLPRRLAERHRYPRRRLHCLARAGRCAGAGHLVGLA